MSAVTVTATWFGPRERPLLGWLHAPADGVVRGGAVICASVGQEHLSSHRGLATLADRLAAAGVAALRYDHPGAGDSADPTSDPADDLVPHWLDGVAHAERFLIDLGLPDVGLVGLRLGALLAANALERCSTVSSLVLWDPCGSGRDYLREQRAFAGLSLGHDEADASGAVEGVGVTFSAATAQTLGSLTLDGAVGAARIEPAPGPGRPAGAAADARGATAPLAAGAEHVPAGAVRAGPRPEPAPRPRQLRLGGAHRDPRPRRGAPRCRRPHADARLAAAVGGGGVARRRRRGDRPRGVARPARTVRRQHLVAGRRRERRDARHRGAVGRLRQPGDRPPRRPGWSWVDLARRLAPAGVRSVRFDRTGVGESAVPGSRSVPLTYTQESVRDVVDVAATLTSEVCLVGLCSGAWAAAAAAPRVGARSVFVLNPVIWQRRPRPLGPTTVGEQDARLVGTLAAGRAPDGARSRVKRLVPHALGFARRPRRRRARGRHPVAAALRGGTEVHLVLGEVEQQLFEAQRGPESVRRMQRLRPGRLHVYAVPDADHSLQRRRGRSAVAELVTTALSGAPVAP